MGQALIDGIEPGSMGEAPEINGVKGLLSRQIRVPAGLETAINAALEQRLHAVVVEREEQALKAIKLLQQRNHGRAQFLPLDSIRQVHPLNLQKETGVVGVASKLIKCDQACRPLIDTLLGRVIIVEDVQAGMRMIRRSLGSVVTRDGVYIEPTGALSGGSIGEEEGEFVRQRELDELPEQIDQLREHVRVSQGQLDNGRAAVEQMVRAAREADDRYDEVRKTGDDGRLDLERERERLYRIRREMDTLQAKRDDIERERETCERTIASARETIQQLETRKQERAASLVEVETELAQATETRESAVRKLSEASGRLASIEGEQRAAEAAREQRQRAREKVEARVAARQEQIASLEREAATIDARIAEAQQRLEALHAEKAQFADDAAPDRDELNRFESRERQVQEELETAREEFFRIERARLDADAELSRAREQINTIRAEMEREGLAPDANGNAVAIDETDSEEEAAGEEPHSEEATSPTISGSGDVDVEELRKEIDAVRRQIRRLGPINAEAPEDYRENKERYDFLTGQMADLTDAEAQLHQAIDELSQEIRSRFTATFEQVNSAFGEYFTAFFGGGTARLVLTDPENPSDSGIDVEAQPPGKRLNSLALLSGGERSLTAVAMLFALLTVNPAPFCVLDEVDAALDEANVGRFTGSLRRLSEKTQFISVTHNRRTVEAADAIYGISMGRDGVSKVLSLKLEDIEKDASRLGQ
ncbi:MAG: hypothetical protein U5Q44_15555 [Dehalococcoidia bacterium]|nr:hypothetical protein [Dehalococcoidia bacterium]